MMPRPPQAVFDELDALSRQRALTDAESLELEWAIDQLDRKPAEPFWNPHKDSRLLMALYNGKTLNEAALMLGCTRSMAAGRYSRIRGMREARGRGVA